MTPTFTDYYQDNILNQYDSYTYKWKMMMVHPDEAHKFEDVAKPDTNRVVVMAETGVESEINLQVVNQSLVLAFKKNRDRNGLANMFSINLIEPGGATFFNRIVLAANRLGIENHLHACYLLELKFIGYNADGTTDEDMVGPFYYVCSMTGLTFDYSDGATMYRADLIETHQEAFAPQQLHLKMDSGNIVANTFGQFLTEFQEVVNDQELKRIANSQTQRYPNVYVFGLTDEAKKRGWDKWEFGASTNGGMELDLGSTSVTGSGTLTFRFDKGTSISDAIVTALLHTANMRKLPTSKGGFHKDNETDGEAKALTFADLSAWYVFETETKYLYYDDLRKGYSKQITFDIKPYTVSELIHDPISFQEVINDPVLQKKRVGQIFKQGLLAKRFDYTYTGLNTEVLNLDISLQNTYFQLQAINHGALMTRLQTQAGEGGPGELVNRLSNERQELLGKIKNLQAEQAKLKNELEKLNQNSPFPPGSGFGNNDAFEGKIAGTKDAIKTQALFLKKLQEQKVVADKAYNEAWKNRPQTEAKNKSPVTNRYMTQSEFYDQTDELSQNMMPLSFDSNIVKSKATGDATPDTKNQGAFMLGAVELNLNSMADLVQQVITIRGDPYWLGAPKGANTYRNGANYARGGVHYFLNMNFPTYPQPDSGFMDADKMNFGIIGMYRVTRVDALYSDGQITMTLQSFRDANTNTGFVIEELMSGRIADTEVKSLAERYKDSEETEGKGDGADDQDPAEETTGNQSDLTPDSDLANLNGGAPGTYTEDQATVAGIRKLAVAPDLAQMLTNVAAETGVDIQVRSGGQDDTTGRPGGSSRRHDNGHAADVALYVGTGSNRRRLSTRNEADLPYIQAVFESARKQGVTGFGAGNGYMGDDMFHMDNAAKYGQGSVAVWGGHSKRYAGAPKWLQTFGKKLT